MPDLDDDLLSPAESDDCQRQVDRMLLWANLYSWELDVAHNFFVVSETLFEYLGLQTPPDRRLSWETWLVLIHPEDRDLALHLVDAVLESRSPDDAYSSKYRLRHRKDNRWIWVHSRGGVVARGPDGRPTRLAGTVQDVTDRKRLEDDLALERQRFDTTVAAARLGTWDWDHLTGKITHNSHYADIVGFPVERCDDPEGSIRVLCVPEDRGRLLEAIELHLSGKTPSIECEFRIVDGRGQTRWLVTHGQNIAYDADGKPLRTVGAIRDVTALKQSEEAIRRHNHLIAATSIAANILLSREGEDFHRGVEEVLALYGRVTDTNRVTFWQNHAGPNDRLCCTLVYHWSTRPAPSFDPIFVTNVDYEKELPGWYEVLSENRCLAMLVRDRGPVERERLQRLGIVSLIVAPIRIDNRFWGFIGFDDCMVERVWSSSEAEALKSAGVLLATAVQRQKTGEQLKAALAQAHENERQSEESGRDRMDLLAGISRDIQSPIHTIEELTDSLLRSDLSREQRADVQAVRDTTQSMVAFLRDFLDFTAIESGRMETVRTAFEIVPLVEDICDAPARAAHQRDLEFSIQMDAAALPRRMIGDPTALRRVLGHLLNNAIRHTDAGETVVQVVTCPAPDGRPAIRFAVMDTGGGVSPERLRQLFSSVDRNELRPRSGTGLELVITKALIELMGGDAGLVSKVGRGSTFWFRLPLDVPVADATAARATLPLSGLALILDANANCRIGLRLALSSLGVDADEAADVPSALALGETKRYDWIFVAAPSGDDQAETLSRHWQRLPDAGPTRLVMLLPVGLADQAAGFTRLGYSAVLFKPVRQAHLRECLLADALAPRPSVPEPRQDKTPKNG